MESKQLTNFRAEWEGRCDPATPPWKMTLEQAHAYIDDDESWR